MKIRMMLPLVLVASAAFVAPASANWFHNPYQNINRNIGSAPNPTPEDLRQMRLPIAVENEQTDPKATATDAKADANTSASAAPQGNTAPQAPGAEVVAATSPSR